MSVQEFFAMGGYAFYVWTSYGVTLVILLANIIIPIAQRKQFFVNALRKSGKSMKPARKQRLILIALMVIGASIATGFALKSFNDNLMYFFSTTDVVDGKAPKDALFRLGGMVIKGSVERPGDGMMVRFKLSDFSKEVTVEYTGILPDLFREGQGIVAHGRLNKQGVFIAEEVLAKHDENYMPPEVKSSLKNQPTPGTGL